MCSNPTANEQIYPSQAAGDAPFSVTEEKLRAAIHVPDDFEYGRNGKIPVVLVSGIAVLAGMTYYYNFRKLGNETAVDVVNAEYVAYSINYIATQTGKSVAVISWSQGGLDTQWALNTGSRRDPSSKTSSPSAPTSTVPNRIRPLLCLTLGLPACTPSVWQKNYTSTFIETFRNDDGDSAYVPTTTIYSTPDEIVQPQSGPNASVRLHDVRGAGVTNAHLQSVRTGQPADGFYSHEGVLYNPLAWALAVDAIVHAGPASIARVDRSVCEQVLPPTLDLTDLFRTEGFLFIAVAELLAYEPHMTAEPAVAGYASASSA
ncbi:lipase B [Penicillium argentinense]|uniref:Lipase B n=1 Tax=Penicillium argentinense TaxID=1131581 RepID=A0A9W9EHX1_9EURO|nr:lipase B [Penicillium argentinense]KAJ5082089.1 lipase B [Penicillium argentinense]